MTHSIAYVGAVWLAIAVTSCDASSRCGGTAFGDYCRPAALSEAEPCPDPDYPKPYTFSDGTVCGTEDSDIGADVSAVCEALGVGCQQASGVCAAPPATLADCSSVGTTYADCGGTGGPVFGCELRGDCRWFLHGCVPETHTATPCPASDLCCLADWPWEGDDFMSQTALFTFAYGTEPWEPGREVNVDVAAPPTEFMEPGLTCSAGLRGGNNPCDNDFTVLDASAFEGGRRIELRPTVGILFGFSLLIELESADGEHARVCQASVTDVIQNTCEATAEGYRPPPRCATEGTVQVGDEHGHVDVTFEDGSTISGWW